MAAREQFGCNVEIVAAVLRYQRYSVRVIETAQFHDIANFVRLPLKTPIRHMSNSGSARLWLILMHRVLPPSSEEG
jgi:hypothetical protein